MAVWGVSVSGEALLRLGVTCDNRHGDNWSIITTDTPVGTYSLPDVPGSQVEVIARTDPERFDWTSNYGIDAIIVKGRKKSHVYGYDNARSDEALAAEVTAIAYSASGTIDM